MASQRSFVRCAPCEEGVAPTGHILGQALMQGCLKKLPDFMLRGCHPMYFDLTVIAR